MIAKRLGAARALRIVGLRRLADLLALVPSHVSSGELPAAFPAIGARRGRVALFPGCVIRAPFADTNAATARVLARHGLGVAHPSVQSFCGALHAHAGVREATRPLPPR